MRKMVARMEAAVNKPEVKAQAFLDIDGVLADFITPLLGMGYPYPEDYHFSNLHPVDKVKVKSLLHSSEFLSTLQPYEGTYEALLRLYEAGIQVSFITSRPKSCELATEGWIRYHYPFVKERELRIIFSRDKGEWLARNIPYLEETIFLVEDAPHQAVGASLAGVRYVYLIDHKYNRWLASGKGGSIIRVESLSEAVRNILLTVGFDRHGALPWDD